MPSKRFFCSICKKVKRVRKLPTNVQNENDTIVKYRIGECDRHYGIANYIQKTKVGAR